MTKLMTPDHLGGNHRDGSMKKMNAPSQIVTVAQHDLDAYGRWTLTVVTDNGERIIRGVRVVSRREGIRSGTRDPLPPEGARGLITFPDPYNNAHVALWQGSIDDYGDGLVSGSPEEAIDLHPSGVWETIEKDGSVTRGNSNGDYEYSGYGGAAIPQVRDEQGKAVQISFARRGINRLLEYALTRTWTMRIAKSLGLQFDGVQRRVGLYMDIDTREGLELTDGLMDVRVGVSRFGENPALATPLAQWNGTYTNLRNLSMRLAKLEANEKALLEQYNKLQTDFSNLKDSVSGGLQAVGVSIGPSIAMVVPGVPIPPTLSSQATALVNAELGEIVDGVKSVSVIDSGSDSVMG